MWVDATPENAAKVLSAVEQFGAPTAQVSAEDFSRPGTRDLGDIEALGE